MRKVGSMYVHGRSANLLKVKVCTSLFFFGIAVAVNP